MIDPVVIDAMIAAGCTSDQVAAVVKAVIASEAKKAKEAIAHHREAERLRKKEYRAKSTVASGMSHGVPRDTRDTPSPVPPSPDKEIPQTLLENTLFPLTPIQTPSPPKGGSVPRSGFGEFWSLYPNKVGKPDAIKAFNRAIQRVELPSMLEGLRAYIAKTDDRPWCNPSTWLNQDRWNDRPAPRAAPQRLTRAEQLQEDLRRRILDEQQNEQNPAGSADLEADERFPRLAYQCYGGGD